MLGNGGAIYTTQPKLPAEIAELYETILRALDGTMTPTEAAEKLGDHLWHGLPKETGDSNVRSGVPAIFADFWYRS
jgi:hypothetical protein